MNANIVGTIAAAENTFAARPNNGFHELIHTMSVETTNCQIVNLTFFLNLDINYKLLSTCWREDELNFLPSPNFYKDTAEYTSSE